MVEIIVALGVFTMLLTTITGIYISIFRVHKKINAAKLVQEDARYTMETLTRKIRMSSINYEAFENENFGPSINNSDYADILYLKDENNEDLIFRRVVEDGRGKLQIARGINLLLEEKLNPKNFIDITPKIINVKELRFYIFPKTSPYAYIPDAGSPPDIQPKVTIYFSSENTTFPEEITLQTTVTSRKYLR